MAELYSSSGLPPAQQAEQFYQKGLELKKAGDLEAALTEFRRAALLDNTHIPAQMEIGRLCKIRAQVEPIYYRHTFEAFRQAARLDLTNTEAHDGYIMAAQKLGRLDEVLLEYDAWLKAHPENGLIATRRKNILTISMAMMPEKPTMNTAGTTKSRRMVILMAGGLFFLGAFLFAGIAFFKMKAPKPGATQSPVTESPKTPAPTAGMSRGWGDSPR